MIDYREDWLLYTLLSCKGSVFLRACYFAVPSATLAVLFLYLDDWLERDFRRETGLLEAGQTQVWSASTGILAALTGFRINRAMSRFWEGTGLLHQMRGEWFDAVSCCVTFSRSALEVRHEETMKFRHTLVRLMSLCHGNALQEIGNGDAESCKTIDPHALTGDTLDHMNGCQDYNFNQVEVILHMIQSLITANLDEGILSVPPPILSRVYQTLSRGFVNLLNAKKIVDTCFPFPFAQLISFLLFANCFITPLMVSCIFDKPVICAVFTFIPVFGLASLNFIGVELENPFGSDPNDLPLDHFQEEMNNCLLMLLHSSSDIMAGISWSRCVLDSQKIKAGMASTRDPSSAERPSVSDFKKYLDLSRDECAAMEDADAAVALGAEKLDEPAGMETGPGGGGSSTEEKLPVEEKLQPPNLQTSMSKAVSALQEIRKAVDTQSGEVRASVEEIRELTSKLQSLVEPVLEDKVAQEHLPTGGEQSVTRSATVLGEVRRTDQEALGCNTGAIGCGLLAI